MSLGYCTGGPGEAPLTVCVRLSQVKRRICALRSSYLATRLQISMVVMWLSTSPWPLIMLILLNLLLAISVGHAVKDQNVAAQEFRRSSGSDSNVREEFREGFRRLSDVKKFEPVGADGRRIEPDEYGAQFSIDLPAREEWCFFQPTKQNSILHVQFQVSSKRSHPGERPKRLPKIVSVLVLIVRSTCLWRGYALFGVAGSSSGLSAKNVI